jgi:hypothetical protein
MFDSSEHVFMNKNFKAGLILTFHQPVSVAEQCDSVFLAD